jgi:hypothetical protein
MPHSAQYGRRTKRQIQFVSLPASLSPCLPLSVLPNGGQHRLVDIYINIYRLVAMASISSMKIMEGAFSLAMRNTSLTMRGPSPRYFCTNSDPTILMKDTLPVCKPPRERAHRASRTSRDAEARPLSSHPARTHARTPATLEDEGFLKTKSYRWRPRHVPSSSLPFRI